MSNKIIFKTSCAVCEHRDVCKYYYNGICGEVQVQLERVAPDIPYPFIVATSCTLYK